MLRDHQHPSREGARLSRISICSLRGRRPVVTPIRPPLAGKGAGRPLDLAMPCAEGGPRRDRRREPWPARPARPDGCGNLPGLIAPEPASKIPTVPLSLQEPDLGPAPRVAPAPEVFRAQFSTSKGTFVIETHRDWSPSGTDRFYELVTKGFYNDTRFYRVLPSRMVQFGLNGSPAVSRAWRAAYIPDDPVRQPNKRGFVSYAMAGPGSRTTQIFINLRDHPHLNEQGFTPFGQVIHGMDVVDRLVGYGEVNPASTGINPYFIETQGNAYLDECCPHLERIISVEIEHGNDRP